MYTCVSSGCLYTLIRRSTNSESITDANVFPYPQTPTSPHHLRLTPFRSPPLHITYFQRTEQYVYSQRVHYFQQKSLPVEGPCLWK